MFTVWDLYRSVWYRRKIVVSIIIAGLIGGLAYILLVPKTYRAEAVLMPNESVSALMSGGMQDSTGVGVLGGSASPISRILGGSGGSSLQKETLVTLQTRAFLISFIQAYKLSSILSDDPKLSGPERLDAAYEVLLDKMDVKTDEMVGTTKIGLRWRSPEVAARWTNDLIAFLNNYMRQRLAKPAERQYQYLLTRSVEPGLPSEIQNVISSLALEKLRIVSLANVEPEFAMRVIDAASPPRRVYSPQPLLVMGVALVGSSILGFFVALGLNAIDNLGKRNFLATHSPSA